MEKNETIKISLKETKERRKTQSPKVYQLKLQNLNQRDVELLDRLFLEAKWLTNYVVSDIQNRLTPDTWKLKEVKVKVKDNFEKREITYLGSQIKQSIVERIKDNLEGLSESKNKGNKVGKLHFKSEINSLVLKQYGNTYTIDFKTNKVHIQGLKKEFRVLGLHQIPDNAEITKGELIKKPSGYYLYVTTFLNVEPDKIKTRKGKVKERYVERFDKPIGIDFGIKDQLTLSNSMKINYKVKESKRLKRLQKQLARKKGFKKGERKSKNFFKTLNKIKREYGKLSNIKKDIENRVFAFIKSYEKVYIQDENIKGWKSGLFGRNIQHTSIGGITSRLKNNLETLVLMDRFLPTTQTCSNCGHKQKISLSDRVFKCESCGFEIDRDWNSARDMVLFGEKTPLKNLPEDFWEATPVEREATARILESNPYIRVSYTSMKQEALSFN
jgi:transposase